MNSMCTPVNDVEVLGRNVGIPGLGTGTIVGAGWTHRVPAVRYDCDGTSYRTLVSGYVVRWDIDGSTTTLPLDRLYRENLLGL